MPDQTASLHAAAHLKELHPKIEKLPVDVAQGGFVAHGPRPRQPVLRERDIQRRTVRLPYCRRRPQEPSPGRFKVALAASSAASAPRI